MPWPDGANGKQQVITVKDGKEVAQANAIDQEIKCGSSDLVDRVTAFSIQNVCWSSN